MKETRVSHRYAKSLIDLALERGELEAVYADMMLVLKTVRDNRDFELLLKSPVVKTDTKQDILKAIFDGKVTKLTSEFMEIITRKRREGQLEAVAAAFDSQYHKHKQILTAVITTATGLDEKLRAQVIAYVKESLKSEVELVEKIDTSLIGGFLLRVGDKQVDASIIRQIRNLERSFSENPYVKEF